VYISQYELDIMSGQQREGSLRDHLEI
jgi:hypothetical protein